MEIDELKRAGRNDGDDSCSDTEYDAASSRPQRVSAQRASRRRRAPSESDDEEPIPEYESSPILVVLFHFDACCPFSSHSELRIKVEEKRTQAAKTASETAPEPVAGMRRKRPSVFSPLSDLSRCNDWLARPITAREEREVARNGDQPTKSKRVRLESDLDDSPTDYDAAEASSTPREEGTASHAGKTSVRSRLTGAPPSKPKIARPAPMFKPASGKPLPTPQWTKPPGEPSKTFKLPTSSFTLNAKHVEAATKQQKGSAKTDSSKSNRPIPSKPSYAEIEPFEFKLLVSHSGGDVEFYESTDLENNMISFWSRLRRLRKEWEDAAGAEWAWELQKPTKKRGRRYCVSRKLAKQATMWREGDAGFYACKHCEKSASLCFTWVEDENAEREDGDSGMPEPKGEFWCLPVHPGYRKLEIKEGREIRTWLNEEDDSESDSPGEIGESSDEDDFKPGSDFSQCSQSESSSEEENGGKESDEDDEF